MSTQQATAPPAGGISAVTQWLEANHAGEFAPAFSEQGYHDLSDVDDAAIDAIVDKAGIAARLKRALAASKSPDPPDADVNATKVTEWLKANDAGEFAKAFFKEGYKFVKNVTDAAIDKIVKPAKPGIAQTLKDKLKTDRKEWDTPAIPDSAVGQPLDLELGKAKVDVENGDQFSVPTELSTKAGNDDVQTANELTRKDWLFLAVDSNMLYGLDMNRENPNDPFAVPKRVLRWVIPRDKQFFRTLHQSADVRSVLKLTEHSASYARAGFESESASASYAFASASVSREKREKEAESSAEKTLYMMGAWIYPRVAVDLRQCTQVAGSFVAAVRNALNAADKFSALQKVFDDYGHAVPTSVELGGQLFFTHEQTVKGTYNKSEVENAIGAAASVKGAGATASTSVLFKNASGSEVTMKSIVDSVSFKPTGGNTLLASTPSEWAKTVNKPHNWAVMQYKDLRSTIDLLPADLQDDVRRIWKEKYPDAPKAVFGAPVSRAVYQAIREESDGFLLGVVRASTDNDDSGYGTLYVKSDASDNPTTLRAQASVHYHQKDDRFGGRNSCMIPLRRGESALTNYAASSTTPNADLWFVPFAVQEPVLQPWGGMSNGDQSIEALTDGFIIGCITAGDETRGRIILKDRDTNDILGASSAHHYVKNDVWYRGNSFCAPVRKGQKLKFETVNGYGTPEVKLFSVPIAGRTIGTRVSRDYGIEYTARESGFFVLVMFGDDGSRQMADVIVDGRVLGATSVHYFENHDTFLTHNSVTVPIAAGSTYKALLGNGFGTTYRSAYFVPIR